MNLESIEEKLVWALVYAAAEASTRWDNGGILDAMLAERADVAVAQFRKRCLSGSGSGGILQLLRKGTGK